MAQRSATPWIPAVVTALPAYAGSGGVVRLASDNELYEDLGGTWRKMRADFPVSTPITAYGTLGQMTWDTSTTNAASGIRPGSGLHFVQTPGNNAAYTFNAKPAFGAAKVSSDKGVALVLPSANGLSFRDWNLTSPLIVRVTDRPRDIALLPNATGLEWLAQLAAGNILRPIGLNNATALNVTTLSRYRRYTSGATRDTSNNAVLTDARSADWAVNTVIPANGIDVVGVLSPQPGTHASASIITAGAASGARVGMLIEAGTEYVLFSTDATDRYLGRFISSYAENSAGTSLLPAASYSSVGGGQAEYSWRITSARAAEFYVNGRVYDRVTFASDITSAGWAIYTNAVSASAAAAVREPVIASSAQAHLGRPVNVLIHGDSISFGEAVNINWADMLTILLRGEVGIGKVTVTNRAVSGADSAAQLTSLNTTGAVGQDVTLIAVGTNDEQAFVSLSTYRANLISMIQKVQTDGSVPVIVIPGMYLDKRTTAGFATQNYLQGGQYHAIARRVAAEYSLTVADIPAALGVIDPNTVSEVTQDNLHPAPFGMTMMAREIGRAVMAALMRSVTLAPLPAVLTVSAAYSLLTTDDTVFANAATAAFPVTLPSAVGLGGKRYHVKKIDATGNAVTLTAASGQTIDGGPTAALGTQYTSLTVISDGSNWMVL